MSQVSIRTYLRRAFKRATRAAVQAVLVLSLITNLIPLSIVHAANSVPKVLNYQARLTDSGGVQVPNGALNVKFVFYDGAGNCLYTVKGTCGTPTAKSVTVTGGVFSTLLGNAADSDNEIPDGLFDNNVVLLGITIGADSEMTPRKRISAAPYALNADRLDDLDVTSSGSTTAYIPSTTVNGNLTITGDPQGTGIADGSMYINPAAAASNETLFGIASNGAARFQIDKEGDITQTGSLLATAASSTAQFIFRAATSPSVNIFEVQNSITDRLFSVNATSTQVTGGARFIVGTTNTLIINSSGNFEMINGVVTRFPSAQGAASTVLTNDGSGNLTWVAASGSQTMLQTFNSSTSSSEIFVNSTQGALTIADQFTGGYGKGLGIGNLFEVQDRTNAAGDYSTRYFTVSSTSTRVFGNLSVGNMAPASMLTVGSGTSTFEVDGSGNLVKVNNVVYSWPSSQGGASTVLQNNGSGTLTWASATSLVNLNQAYLSSTSSAEISLTPSVGAVTIADTFSGTGNIFEIQDRTNAAGDYSRRYLTVSATATIVRGRGTVSSIEIGTTTDNGSNLTIRGDNAYVTSEAGKAFVFASPGAGAIYFSVNGLNRFFIDSSGNGSFGHTTPNARFNISVRGTTNNILEVNDGNTSGVYTARYFTVSSTSTIAYKRLEAAAHANGQGLLLPTFAGAPTAVTGTAEGDIVWNSTNDNLYVYTGSAFQPIGGLSVGSSMLTTYNSSTSSSEIYTNSTQGALTIADQLTGGINKGVGIGNLFEVQDRTTAAGDYTARFFTISSTATLANPANNATGYKFAIGSAAPTSTLDITGQSNVPAMRITGFSTTGSDVMASWSGTWNTASANVGFLMNITDTASAAGAALTQWQLNGTTVYNFSKSGVFTVTGNSSSASLTSGYTPLVLVNSDKSVNNVENMYFSDGSGVGMMVSGQFISHGTSAVGNLIFATRDNSSTFAARLTVGATNTTATNHFTMAAHAANAGLTLPTFAGVPTAVTGTTEGDVVWNSTSDALYVYTGSAFQNIATTLLQAYNNSSSTAEPYTNSTQGALTIADQFTGGINKGIGIGNLFEVQDRTNASGDYSARFFTISSTSTQVLNSRFLAPAHANNQGLNLPTFAGAPTAVTGTAEGDIVWNSTNDNLYVYTGSAFQPIGGLSVGSSMLTTYNSSTSSSEIYVNSTQGALTIADQVTGGAGKGIGIGNLFEIQDRVNASGDYSARYFTISSTATVIGNASSTYIVTPNARFAGNLTPSADATYTLGDPALRWKDLWLSGGSAKIAYDTSGTSVLRLGFETAQGYRGLISTPAGTPLQLRTNLSPDITNGITIDGTGNVSYGLRFSAPAHANNAGLKLPIFAGAPSAVTGTAEGDIVWNSSGDHLYVYNGASFTQIDGGGATPAMNQTYLAATSTTEISTNSTQGALTIADQVTGGYGKGIGLGNLFEVQDRVNAAGDWSQRYFTVSSTSVAINPNSPAATFDVNHLNTLAGMAFRVETNGTELFSVDYQGNMIGQRSFTLSRSAEIGQQNDQYWPYPALMITPFADFVQPLINATLGGVQRFTVNYDGSVGILTGTPMAELDVRDSLPTPTTNIFQVANFNDSTRYLTVSSTGTTVTNLTITGTCTGCGGVGSTNLNQAYLASTGTAEISLTPSIGAVTVADTFSGTGNIFEIQDRTNATGDYSQRYFSVSATSTLIGSLGSNYQTGIGTPRPSASLTVASNVETPTSNVFEVQNRSSATGNYTSKYFTVSSTATLIGVDNLEFTDTVNTSTVIFDGTAGGVIRTTGSGSNITFSDTNSSMGFNSMTNASFTDSGAYTTLGLNFFTLTSSSNRASGSNLLQLNDNGIPVAGSSMILLNASSATAFTGIKMVAGSLSTGTGIDLTLNGLTTGKGISVTSTSTGLTTGSLLNLSSGTTGAVATNGIALITATGNYTSSASTTGLLSLVANSTTGGMVQSISGDALTTGTALYMTAQNLTTGRAVYLSAGSNASTMRTGNTLSVYGGFGHTAAEAGSAMLVTVRDNSTASSVTNGIDIQPIFGAVATASITRTLNGLKIEAPTQDAGSGCNNPASQTCTYNGISVSTQDFITANAATNYNITGFNLPSTGSLGTNAAGTITWTGMNLTMPATAVTSGGSVNTTAIKITGSTSNSGGTAVAFGSDYNAGGVGIGTFLPRTQLDVTGTATTTAVGTTSLNAPASAVWVQGDYAYVAIDGGASNDSIEVVDVSDPKVPKRVTYFSIGSSVDPASVVVEGRYAYVANRTGNTFQIYDIQNPNGLKQVASLATGTNGVAPRRVAINGNRAYFTSTSSTSIGVVDISDPTNPKLLTTSGTSKSQPQDIVVAGKYAYVATQGDAVSDNVDIFDIQGDRPILASSFATGSNSNPQAVYVQGKYMYVLNASANTMQIVDVSDPKVAKLVGTFTSSGAGGYDVAVQGTRAYISWTSGFIETVDVSNPAAPISVARISTGAPTPQNLFVQGRYLYLVHGGQASNSFKIFDIGGAYIQQLEVGGAKINRAIFTSTMQANDATFLGGVNIGNSLNLQGGLAVSSSTSTNLSADLVNFTLNPQSGGSATGTLLNMVHMGNGTIVRMASKNSPTTNLFEVLETSGAGNGTYSKNFFVISSTNTVIGSASNTFVITPNARINGNLTTNTDNVNRLGDPALRWNNLFASTISVPFDTAGTSTLTIGFETTSTRRALITSPETWPLQLRAGSGSATTTPGVYINPTTRSVSINSIVNPTNSGVALDVGGTIEFTTGTATATSGLCHATNGNNRPDQLLLDCSGAPAADYMEMYPAAAGLEMGDIVMPGSETYNGSHSGAIPRVVKTPSAYAGNMIGVISNPADAGDFNSIGYEFGNSDLSQDPLANAQPVALKGRVKVKVNTENGPIKIGDPITSSSVAGVGMKATKPGMIVGQALSEWNGPGQGMILVFMGNGYHSGMSITTDGVKSLFGDDFAFKPIGVSSASGTSFSSYALNFGGSAWDSASNSAVTRNISIRNDVTNANTYQLTFQNTQNQTLAALNNSGDLSIAGSLTVNGGFDYAETFPAAPDLDAGDLVMVDPENTTGYGVKKSDKKYENTLIGVISTKPGFLTGKSSANTQPVALAGRVPVKVNTESGEIKPGDPITSSSVAGVGMKAAEAGRVIGIALQGWNGNGVGTIMVFVNPSWWNGPAAAASATAGSGLSITENSLLDFKNSVLSNVSAIVSTSGLWSISSDGFLVAEKVEAKEVNTRQLTLKNNADTAVSERIVGRGHFAVGSSAVLVQNVHATADSIIVITFEENPGSNWWIAEKHDGLFMLKLAQPAIGDTPFTYWILPIDGGLEPVAAPPDASTTSTPPIGGGGTPPVSDTSTGSGSSTSETGSASSTSATP